MNPQNFLISEGVSPMLKKPSAILEVLLGSSPACRGIMHWEVDVDQAGKLPDSVKRGGQPCMDAKPEA
jgi:hypothetical protein